MYFGNDVVEFDHLKIDRDFAILNFGIDLHATRCEPARADESLDVFLDHAFVVRPAGARLHLREDVFARVDMVVDDDDFADGFPGRSFAGGRPIRGDRSGERRSGESETRENWHERPPGRIPARSVRRGRGTYPLKKIRSSPTRPRPKDAIP
jgi:hypothetical protein